MNLNWEECMIFLFSELYNETFNIYYRFISQSPENRYVEGENAAAINLFYRIDNLSDSLFVKILINILGHIKELKRRKILIDL